MAETVYSSQSAKLYLEQCTAYTKSILYPIGTMAIRRPRIAVGLRFLIADGDVVRVGSGPFVDEASFEDVTLLQLHVYRKQRHSGIEQRCIEVHDLFGGPVGPEPQIRCLWT